MPSSDLPQETPKAHTPPAGGSGPSHDLARLDLYRTFKNLKGEPHFRLIFSNYDQISPFLLDRRLSIDLGSDVSLMDLQWWEVL